MTLGAITEYPIPGSFGPGLLQQHGPRGICAGPDGNIWFCEWYGSRVTAMSTLGAVVASYPLPPVLPASSQAYVTLGGNGALSIVSGSDGALWFSEYLAGRVGRITTAGVLTEYPCPGAPCNAFPTDLATDSTAQMLVGLSGRGSVALVGTDGTFNESILGAQGVPSRGPIRVLGLFSNTGGTRLWLLGVGFPLAVELIETTDTLGPTAVGSRFTGQVLAGYDVAGALPFSGAGLHTVKQGPHGGPGGLFLDSPATFYPGPAGCAPHGIVNDAGIDIWFTDPGTNSIGRFDTHTLAITEYPLPTPNAYPEGICLGSDGRLWVSERDADQIAAVSTS